jgi:general secretion pathway protein D
MKAFRYILSLICVAALAVARAQTNAPIAAPATNALPNPSTNSFMQSLTNRLPRQRLLSNPRPGTALGTNVSPLTPAEAVITNRATPRPMPAFPVPNMNDDPRLPAPGAAQVGNPVAANAPRTTGDPGATGATTPGGTSLDENAGVISLKGAPLEDVFDMYMRFSERTVLRPYTLPVQGITLFSATDLSRREAIEALDSVLALNGIVMINMGDKFVKAVPAAQADKEGAALHADTAASLPNAEVFVTKVVTLKVAVPSEVAPTLVTFSKSPNAVTPIDSNKTIVLRDYASNVKRMLELLEKVDVEPEQEYTLAVIPIRYGKVSEIYATMSALISGAGGGGGGAAGTGFTQGGVGGRGGMGGMNNMMGGGMNNMMGGRGNYGGMGRNSMNRGNYGGGGYGGGNYGGGGYGGSMYPQQVTQPSAAGANANFQSRLNQLVSKAAGDVEKILGEGANIVPDERSNKLLIYANKRDMAMITNIVEKVDVLLAQVLIEAVILEVVLGDTLNYGVSVAQRAKRFGNDFIGTGASRAGNANFFNTLTNFPAGAPEGFSYFGTIGQSFDVAVAAVSEDRKANLVSKPRIQTSHAIPGTIFVGETRPYVTGFSDYGGYVGSGLTTRSQVQERTIGLTLDVTPFITPEGLVVMELAQQYDSPAGTVNIEGNPYPLVDSRMAQSMLTVRDGDIIMLGGLIRESNQKTKRGVPFLKDIPGLGAAFRSTTHSGRCPHRTDHFDEGHRAANARTGRLHGQHRTRDIAGRPAGRNGIRSFRKQAQRKGEQSHPPAEVIHTR